MWKITFLRNGYVLSVVYQDTPERGDAIEFAVMGMGDSYTHLRCEKV